MKKAISMMITGILFTALLVSGVAPFMTAQPEPEQTTGIMPIYEVYMTPEHPIGASDWMGATEKVSGNDADQITLHVKADPIANWAEVRTGFCNNNTCVDVWDEFNPWYEMTHLGNGEFEYVLPGDHLNELDKFYLASESDLMYVTYQILVGIDPSWVDYSYYPDYNGNALDLQDDEYVKFYPTWAPTQTNATSQVSKAVLYPGETFWVNGTSNYWNSTSYPGDYSKLIPVSQTNVTVSFNPSQTIKTDDNGNYSFQFTAPLAPSTYMVNTTLTNNTPNWNGNQTRNVPCVSPETQIEVLDFDIEVNAVPNATYPNKDISVNGDVLWGDASAVTTGSPVSISIVETGDSWNTNTNAAGHYDQTITVPGIAQAYTIQVEVDDTATGHVNTNQTELTVRTPSMMLSVEASSSTTLPDQTLTMTGHAEYGNSDIADSCEVNITIDGETGYWNGTTDVNGNYSINITTPLTVGNYTVNATVESTLYGISDEEQTDIQVVAVPVPDLTIVASSVTITAPDGMFEGEEVNFTAMVKNVGIANATDVLVSFLVDGVEVDNETVDLLIGANTTITVTWPAVAGNHTLNISADPENTITESFENNNVATKAFDIDMDTDGDGIGDLTDPDIDGDGYNNTDDDFPEDATEWLDSDEDGEGDNADTDDDGDGVPDVDDDFPLDPTEDTDTDDDGVGDNADTDDDGDGVLDVDDAFPLDDAETADYDGDGIGDNADPDDDEDGYLDASEDPELWDTDNDGLTNDIDNDDDNDGTLDTSDTMPLDTDNDGLTNAEDDDDDGDGVLDKDEDLNWNGIVDDNETSPTNSDTDGDGVDDKEDYDPLDPEVSLSSDVNDGDGGLIIFGIVGIVLIVAAILGMMMMSKGKGPGNTGTEETEPEAKEDTAATESAEAPETPVNKTD
ncbi:MAG: hypothetical protein KAS67_00070 [Thermoplasmata archaeon]|nr:hypothetical protein [Thermoplasmata archaeon]